MSDFGLWFGTGVQHITDLGGYDHILFVALLSISFTFATWRKLVVMITSFTLGHSISLAVSVLTNIDINTALIELLIALSIFVTSVYQLWAKENTETKWIYITVVLFGLIHGTGFSYLLKAMLGREEAVALPLFYFNLGLEVGQLLIVAIVLVMNLIVANLKIKFQAYKMVVVSLIGIISLKMVVERLLLLF